MTSENREKELYYNIERLDCIYGDLLYIFKTGYDHDWNEMANTIYDICGCEKYVYAVKALLGVGISEYSSGTPSSQGNALSGETKNQIHNNTPTT